MQKVGMQHTNIAAYAMIKEIQTINVFILYLKIDMIKKKTPWTLKKK